MIDSGSSLRESLPHPSAGAVRGAIITGAILGLISTLGATLYLVTQGIGGEPLPLRAALPWQAVQYAAWIPVAGAIGWMLARSAARSELLPIVLLRLTIFSAFVVPAHGLLAAVATRWMREMLNPGDAGAGIVARLLADLPTQILQFWALVAALLLLATRTRLRERDRTAERLTADLNAARLEQLRARLQPHFLFNTLQSIAILIPREPESAQRMTIQLGDLLRASLRTERAPRGHGTTHDDQMVTLREEVALLRCYLDIEAQRFRDRLHVEWQVDDETLNAPVPDLLLQPLVENALRHGLWPSPTGGVLRISTRMAGEMLELLVEDSGVGLPATWRDGAHDGVGLSVTRARLQGIYSGGATLTVVAVPRGGTCTTVRLPWPQHEGQTLAHDPEGVS